MPGILMEPPGRPVPCTVSGGQPVGHSTLMSCCLSASTRSEMGRLAMCSSPSNVTGPGTSVAMAVRKRTVVPELPMKSGLSGTRSLLLPPRTTMVVSPTFSTSMPIPRSAFAMWRVSSLCSTPRSSVVPSDSAASTSPRFVIDLEPGTVQVASIAPPSGTTSIGGWEPMSEALSEAFWSAGAAAAAAAVRCTAVRYCVPYGCLGFARRGDRCARGGNSNSRKATAGDRSIDAAERQGV